MTFAEMHAAIREVLHAAGLYRFTLSVHASEWHPGRVDVQWSLFISRDPPAENLSYTTTEPPLMLKWLRSVLGPPPADVQPELASVGAVSADDVVTRQ